MAQQEEFDLRQRQAADQQRWEQQAEESESEEEESDGEEGAAKQGGQQAQAQQAQQQAAQQQGQQQGHQGGAAAAGPPGGGGAGPAAAAAAEQGEGGEGGEDAQAAGPSFIPISEVEAQENAAAFLDTMRQRFLAGQDAGVDYAAIDAGGMGGCARKEARRSATTRWNSCARPAALPAPLKCLGFCPFPPHTRGWLQVDCSLRPIGCLCCFSWQMRSLTKIGRRSASRMQKTPTLPTHERLLLPWTCCSCPFLLT